MFPNKSAYEYITCLWDSSIPLESRWAPHIRHHSTSRSPPVIQQTQPTNRCQKNVQSSSVELQKFLHLRSWKAWVRDTKISKRFAVCQGVSHCLNLRSHPHPGRYPGCSTNSLCFGISFFVGVKGEVWGIFPGYVGKIAQVAGPVTVLLQTNATFTCTNYMLDCSYVHPWNLKRNVKISRLESIFSWKPSFSGSMIKLCWGSSAGNHGVSLTASSLLHSWPNEIAWRVLEQTSRICTGNTRFWLVDHQYALAPCDLKGRN